MIIYNNLTQTNNLIKWQKSKATNGMIIIYGGKSNNDFQVTPDLAVFNTETFEWAVPSVSSNIGHIPSLAAHSANLVGNYMIVAFGK